MKVLSSCSDAAPLQAVEFVGMIERLRAFRLWEFVWNTGTSSHTKDHEVRCFFMYTPVAQKVGPNSQALHRREKTLVLCAITYKLKVLISNASEA